VGLTLVALGAGAAKLAPQSLAPRLFAADPELRDRGLMLMYLLANVSALVSPVIGETARAGLGWPAALALALLSLEVASLIIQTQSHVLRVAESTTPVHGEAGQTHGRGSLVVLFRRCTLVVLAVSPLLARALLHLKATPGLPTAAAKIALGMLATGLGYVPLLVAAERLPDGSLAGLGWLRVGLRCCPWKSCWPVRSALRSCCVSHH